MKKIIIAGIGGVGGYFGGLLAKHYTNNEEVEINFVARGEHLEAIKKNGLLVKKGEEEFIAKPTLATNEPAEIGIADLIILCTKSYDLESILEQLKPCVNKDTILLPLLNGVDSRARIEKTFPENMVLDGCVYIVSRLTQAGVVENIGNIQTLYFGLDELRSQLLLEYEKLFREAGIEASLSENISTQLWEKFIFLSPIATATSYYDKSIGELLLDNENIETILKLITELKQIADANGIVISEDITEKTLNKIKSLPYGATSSLHSDIKSKKPKNELATLIGYVIDSGKKYGIEVPVYSRIHSSLVLVPLSS